MKARTSDMILAFALGISVAAGVVYATTPKIADPAPCKRPVFVKSLSGDGWESLTYRCQDGSLLIRELVK